MGELVDDYQKMCEFLMLLASSLIDGGGHLAPAGVAVGGDGSCTAVMAHPDSFPIADPEEIELRELRREGLPTVPAIKLILESRAGRPANYY